MPVATRFGPIHTSPPSTRMLWPSRPAPITSAPTQSPLAPPAPASHNQKLLGVASRRLAARLAGQHARELDHPTSLVQTGGECHCAAVDLLLGHANLIVGEGGHLGEVRDNEDLP